MKVTDFVKGPFFSLPKTQPNKSHFMDFVANKLKAFRNKLNDVEGFEDVEFDIYRIRERQEHLTFNILRSLTEYYNGKPANAYKALVHGLTSEVKDFREVLYKKRHTPGESLYRIRYHNENFPLEKNNLFHIPFELRGKVKTQRFSIPGFPSLYLGDSIYTCWEELNRPNINDFIAVRLEAKKSIRLLDISPPKFGNPLRYYHYLMMWPIAFTCSTRVKNPKDSFKPEYIMPQLLLQWIRQTEDLDGIEYQTTHIDFTSCKSKGQFNNIVLPVKEINNTGLCSELKSMFLMTDATSVQLNDIASRNRPNGFLNPNPIPDAKVTTIELIKGFPQSYAMSAFGSLESLIQKMTPTEIK